MIRSGLKKMLTELQTVHWIWFYILWTVMVLFLIWFNQNIVTTRESVEKILGPEFSPVQIDLYVSVIREISFKFYFVIPFIILFRLFLMALVLHLFLMINQLELSIRKIFRIVCMAFSAVVLKDAVKLFSLYWINNGSAYNDEIVNTPFSLASLFPSVDRLYLFRLLNEINIFEVLWVLIILFFLRKWTKFRTKDVVIPVIFARWFSLICLWGLGVFYDVYFL